MKVVILAGGYGTRISEESQIKPKPMIEIGYKPILWHIMKIYSHFGFNEFVICLGYKGYMIKEYFAHYFLHESDVTFDFSDGGDRQVIHGHFAEPWKVTLVDTGLNTMTGGRLKRIRRFVGDEPFMMTYGDGVCDVDINKLVDFHKRQGKMVTLTAVQPGGRFGVLEMDRTGTVTNFNEKPQGDGGWINGGFFVMEPAFFDYLGPDDIMFEREPLARVAAEGQLNAYQHPGFWQCMDKMSDKMLLESLWESHEAPWKLW
jgi:glucose-1-phosphate cytidylyltransferase